MSYCITYSFVCEMRLAARRIGHIPNMPQFLPTSVLCWFHAARHISYSSQHLSDGASLVVPILSVISVSRFLIYTATQLFSSPRALGPSAMVGPPLGISLGYVLLCLADYFVSITVPSILVFLFNRKRAGIVPLLDVEDMVAMTVPDWKCVFMYVQSIYREFVLPKPLQQRSVNNVDQQGN